MDEHSISDYIITRMEYQNIIVDVSLQVFLWLVLNRMMQSIWISTLTKGRSISRLLSNTINWIRFTIMFYCFFICNKTQTTSLYKDIGKTVNNLFFSHPLTQKPFLFNTRNSTDNTLKNHYIISNKTSINKDKSTCKKPICNQKKIN